MRGTSNPLFNYGEWLGYDRLLIQNKYNLPHFVGLVV